MQEKILILKSIFKNSTIMLGIKIFMPITSLIIIALLSRILGVKEFGMFITLGAYYGVFRIISIFGIDTFLTREVSCDKSNISILLGNACFIGLISSICCAIAMSLIFFCIPEYSYQIKLAAIIMAFSLLPGTLISYIDSVFIAIGKIEYSFFAVLLRESLKIILMLFVLLYYKNFLLVIIVMSLTSFLGLFLNLFFLNKFVIKYKICFIKNISKKILKTSFIFVSIAAISNIFLVTDIIVLSKIRGDQAVGIYSAACKFVALSFFFFESIGSILLPIISKMWQESILKFTKIIEITLKYFLIFIFIFIIFVYFFSDKIIYIIFGNNFSESIFLLHITIWNTLFLGGSYFISRVLLAMHMQKYDFFFLSIVSIVNLILNIWFTVLWGYTGTAIATVISGLLLLMINSYFLYKNIFFVNIQQNFLKPIIAGLLLFVLYLFFIKINPYIDFLLSIFIYLFILIILKIVDKSEFLLLKNLIFNKREEKINLK